MNQTLRILATVLSMALTIDAQAGLAAYRSSTPCKLRNSADCKNVAVFLRDAQDKCIKNLNGTPSNCLMAFCTSHCAVPEHQTISEVATPLCAKHCMDLDLMNHKLQENLVEHFPDALTEEAAQALYSEGRERDQRDAKEQVNFNAVYGGTIAQLKKAAWDRVNADEKRKYYQYHLKQAEESYQVSNELWKTTKLSLSNSGFKDPEIRGFVSDAITAEQKLKNTPGKDIQIGASKVANQVFTQVSSLIRRPKSPISSAPGEGAEEEITGGDLMDDGIDAGI